MYLGIKVLRNPKFLFKLTYMDMIDGFREMISKWKHLPMSLSGCFNIINMVVLQKCLYLFQNISIFLTASFFKTIDSIVMPFIWSYKPPRISKAHL